MMKRNILAVVIPALLAVGAANAAEIYNKDGNKLDLNGKVNGLRYFSDDNSNEGDKTYVRLGFKGETQINSDLTGYGRFEYEFKGNRAESNQGGDKTRFAFVGLKVTDFGSLDYGRNLGIAYDGISYTDVLPEFGGDQAYTDNLTQRVSGVATYRNKGFFGLVDGLNFGLQYQGKNTESTNNSRLNEEATQNGDGWGTSLEYASPIGVSIIGSYATYSRTDAQRVYNGGKGQNAEAAAVGLKYDANSIYVAATYGEYRNLSYIDGSKFIGVADKTTVFEAVAQYNFDFGLTPSLGYVAGKAKDDTTTKTNDYITKYVSVGGTYAFNKNFSTYAEYEINLLKDDNAYGVSSDDVIAVGLTYQF